MAKPAQALRIARLRFTRYSGSVGSGGVVCSVSSGVSGGGGLSEVLSGMGDPLQGGVGRGRDRRGGCGSGSGARGRVLVGVEDPARPGGEVVPGTGEDVD